jgi:hypothetical protein
VYRAPAPRGSFPILSSRQLHEWLDEAADSTAHIRVVPCQPLGFATCQCSDCKANLHSLHCAVLLWMLALHQVGRMDAAADMHVCICRLCSALLYSQA